MFKIEELLCLFENVDVKQIILSSYLLSQEKDKRLSDDVFQQLLFLKTINPNINIKITDDFASPSKYTDNVIYLNGGFDEVTFFHELTHLFSYSFSKFSIPNEYSEFQYKFLLSNDNQSLLVSFINLCEQEKAKIYENMHFEPLISSDLYNNKFYNGVEVSKKDFLIKLSIIKTLEDIVDSITGGRARDFGLRYQKDTNHLVKKSKKSSGHGCSYFMTSSYEFEEILADYQAINLIDPDNHLFNILKTILGREFITFLNSRCQMINGSKNFLEENNRIYK